MSKNEGVDFEPIALRGKLAERSEGVAEFLAFPLSAVDDAAQMPGWREWHAYRGLPPEEQDPPGLTAGDFAAAYRGIAHPAGIADAHRFD
jgi:hypothetical protein